MHIMRDSGPGEMIIVVKGGLNNTSFMNKLACSMHSDNLLTCSYLNLAFISPIAVEQSR